MVFAALGQGLISLPLHWLLARPCPLCRQLPGAAEPADPLCRHCSQRLALPPQGLSGSWPLTWWSSGLYADELRRTLLHQRRHPDAKAIRALMTPLAAGLEEALGGCPRSGGNPRPVLKPLLVPVPSWKQRSNPLPGLIADALAGLLGLRRRDLLVRSRAVLGQHHLGRQLRLLNQQDSFALAPIATGVRPGPALIVDDILTSGSTARQAALCLECHGWEVLGLACLARTPARSRGRGGCRP